MKRCPGRVELRRGRSLWPWSRETDRLGKCGVRRRFHGCRHPCLPERLHAALGLQFHFAERRSMRAHLAAIGVYTGVLGNGEGIARNVPSSLVNARGSFLAS
jgi:hypothetical protein